MQVGNCISVCGMVFDPNKQNGLSQLVESIFSFKCFVSYFTFVFNSYGNGKSYKHIVKPLIRYCTMRHLIRLLMFQKWTPGLEGLTKVSKSCIL